MRVHSLHLVILLCWHKQGRLNPSRVLSEIEYQIKKEPFDFYLYYERAVYNEKVGNKHQALEDYGKAIQLSKYSQLYFFEGRGKLLLELGRFEEALENFNMALRQSLNGYRFPATYFNRARAFIGIREFQKAELDIRRALHLDPENGEFLQLLIDIKSYNSRS